MKEDPNEKGTVGVQQLAEIIELSRLILRRGEIIRKTVKNGRTLVIINPLVESPSQRQRRFLSLLREGDLIDYVANTEPLAVVVSARKEEK